MQGNHNETKIIARISELINTAVFKIFLFVVLVSPLLYYWIYSIWINPSYNYYTNDAEFPYFLNSLAVFKGGSYRYVDHPGTPLEILGTIFLAIMRPFSGDTLQGFIRHQLEHPELFFNFAQYFLIVSFVLCICVFFWIASSPGGWRNMVYGAALSVAYFAVHPLSLSSSTIWNHNSFNFPFGTLLLLALYKFVGGEGDQHKLSFISLTLLGLGAGILTSVTIYMAGWIVGIATTVLLYLVLKKTSLGKIILMMGVMGVSTAVGFFVSVLPVIQRMPFFRNWIIRLLTHQSPYLAVPRGQPMLERLVSNFLLFYKILPVLFVSFVTLLILSAIAFFLFRRKIMERPGLWALVFGLGVQSLAILLVFLDRPLRDMYFLSLASIFPVWLMALLRIFEYSPVLDRFLKTSATVLIFTGMVIVSIHSVDLKRSEVSTLSNSKQMISNAVVKYAEKAKKPPSDLVVLWMYGSPSPCWGLWLGNFAAANVFDSDIEQVCPSQYLLSNNLRVSIPNRNVGIFETPWDVLFGCKKNEKRLREYNPSIKIEEYPELDWMCGKAIVAFNDR